MKTAIIIATGPSVTQELVDGCRGKGTVYVVKEAYRLAPWADHLYCGDYDWFDYYEGLKDFAGKKWCCCPNAAAKWGLEYVEPRNDWNWSHTDGVIATGGNSGFQTMNLAELHGHDRIILLGFDMQYGAKRNFYTGADNRPKRPSNFDYFIKCLRRAKPHMRAEVINCSMDSVLEMFPKMELADALHL